GVITWGSHVEDAYWKMENTEAYCQMISIAKSLSSQLTEIAPKEMEQLLGIRRKLGMDTVARG
ncbi:MAG: class II aldolase/adducin family protein, partial [Opitutales bacterium]